MLRSQSRLIGYLLPIALAAFYLSPNAVSAQSKQTFVYAPPSLSLTPDSTRVSACSVGGGGPQVKLNTRASSPGGFPIAYRWSVSKGRIIGDGPIVTWDLSGVAAGTYKASVEIQTGPDGNACDAFASTSVAVM